MLDLPQDQTEAAHLCESMHRFKQLPQVRAFYDWLQSELVRLDAKSRRLRGEDAEEIRGGRILLEDILNLVEQSSEKADAIRQTLSKKGV